MTMEWGRGLGLGPSLFPEAVDLGEALDTASFPPPDGSSPWGGAVGTSREKLQGRGGNAELCRGECIEAWQRGGGSAEPQDRGVR